MNVKRARYFRAARIAVLVLVVAFFLLPYDVRSWFPVWLLFLAALALEVDFFLGGWLQARRETPVTEAPDRGPQQRDLSDLGSWDYWDPSEPTPPVVVDPGFRWIHVVEAVGVLAVIAVLLYAPSRNGHVRRRGRVRRLRPGRGRAGRGRRRPGVPDARDLRHALPARDQAPGAVGPAHCPCDRGPRPRGVAPAWRGERGPGALLRRADRPEPRPPAQPRARADARAAGDECVQFGDEGRVSRAE